MVDSTMPLISEETSLSLVWEENFGTTGIEAYAPGDGNGDGAVDGQARDRRPDPATDDDGHASVEHRFRQRC